LLRRVYLETGTPIYAEGVARPRWSREKTDRLFYDPTKGVVAQSDRVERPLAGANQKRGNRNRKWKSFLPNLNLVVYNDADFKRAGGFSSVRVREAGFS
jgi:hypothetical protein